MHSRYAHRGSLVWTTWQTWLYTQCMTLAQAGGNGAREQVAVSTVIGKAMRRAGVPGTAHALRHWYATALVESGADLRTVQTLMRHASLATTERYVRVDEQRRVDAVERLDPWREAS